MSSTATPTAPHDCGICDAPLRFDAMDDGRPTYVCTDTECDAWHTSRDCCEQA